MGRWEEEKGKSPEARSQKQARLAHTAENKQQGDCDSKKKKVLGEEPYQGVL